MKSLKLLLTTVVILLYGAVTNAQTQSKYELNYIPVNENEVYVTYASTPYECLYSGNIVIPSATTINGKTYIVTGIGQWAFFRGYNIESITIPNTVKYIGLQAFCGCTKIKRIEIPGSVKEIDRLAFDSCDELTEVIINEGVTTIGERMFSYCPKIDKITFPRSLLHIEERAFEACNSIKTVTIPDNVETIGESAFLNCKGIESVTVSGNTKLGNWVFQNCTSLSNVVLMEGLKSLGAGTFDCCTSLSNIIFPHKSLTSIGEYVFSGCTSLTEITIPQSVTNIETGAFLSSGFTEITIPQNVTSIGVEAFANCHNLKKITIPQNLTSIGKAAFSGCNNLEKITIPASVTEIGNNAFEGCGKLSNVTSYIPANKLFALDTYVFYNIDWNCILYVPKGAKEIYSKFSGWKDFINIIEMEARTFDLAVSSVEYATIYLDYAAEIPSGVEVYTTSKIDGDRLKMQQVTGVLPANTGAIVKAPAGIYTFVESTDAPAPIEGNLLKGTTTDTYIPAASSTEYYVLSILDGVVGMYKAVIKDGKFFNNANKVYMVLGDESLGIYDDNVDTSQGGGQLSAGYRFDFSGTTGVESITTESTAAPVYYDLSGRRVENPSRGIYILNDRKVLVK